jgi:hypothetical protein
LLQFEAGKHFAGTLVLQLHMETAPLQASQDFSVWFSHPRIATMFYVVAFPSTK